MQESGDCGTPQTDTEDFSTRQRIFEPIMSRAREVLSDFLSFVLVPFIISTLAFVFLFWFRDPTRLEHESPFAFLGGGVIGIFGFFGLAGGTPRVLPCHG